MLTALLLVVASLSSSAETVTVRLFSQHAPVAIRITPRTTLQIGTCQTCSSSKLASPLQITAAGDRLRVVGENARQPQSRSQLVILGAGYQLEATGAPPLQLDVPLAVAAAHGTPLITIT